MARHDLNGHVLNIKDKTCIDANRNIVPSDNIQQYKWPKYYIHGFKLVWKTRTKIEIQEGTCRDILNNFNISLLKPIIIDFNCTSDVTADVWYNVFIIADSKNILKTSGIFVITNSDIILPNGYDSYRRIGCIIYNSILKAIQPFYTLGKGSSRIVYWDMDTSLTRVINNGVPLGRSTFHPASKLTTLDLSLFMPYTSNYVYLKIATNGTIKILRNTIIVKGTTERQIVNLDRIEIFTRDNQTIDYLTNGSKITLDVIGYVDDLNN